MDGADWAPVVIDKRRSRTTGESKDAAMARAMRTGAVATERKVEGGTNPGGHAAGGAGATAWKLDEDSEHFAHSTVSHDLSLAIQQARLAKKMTQKELGAVICEKPTVVADYEAGRAIPNPSILSKLDRALGVHLPRPSKKK